VVIHHPAEDFIGACIELAVNGATKLAPVEALGRTSLIVQIVTIAPLVTANLTVTTDETGACIELTSRSAAKITAVEALGRAGLTVKFLAIAQLAIVDLAVTTVLQRHSATTGIELAGSSTAKITASETVIRTGLTVQCLAITLLAIVDLAVTTVDRLQGATTGIEPTVSSTAKITASEAVIPAGITVQCLAITLLAIVNLAVAAVGRRRSAAASVELTGSSTSKLAPSKALGNASLTVQFSSVTPLVTLDLAIAKHCIVVTATATQRNQCTHQHKHWHQAPF
jgi:heme exporter protein D